MTIPAVDIGQAAAWGVRLAFSATLLWLAAGLAAWLLRRSSAAVRHRAWGLSVLAALALPVPIACLPEVRLGWLQARNDRAAPDVVPPVDRQPGRIPGFEPSPSMRERTPTDGSDQTFAALADKPPLPTVRAEQREDSPARESIAINSPPVSRDGPLSESKNMSRSGSFAAWSLVILLTPMAWGFAQLARALAASRRIVRQSTAIVDPRCRRRLAEIAARLGRTQAAGAEGLRQSDQTPVPLCAGWRRPCIILPGDWRSWSDETLRAVLAHELSHVVRRDVAWQLAARVACALYWFHPLAWLAAWRMRVEREAACDDGVLRAGEKPAAYARALVDLTERLSARQLVPNVAVAMAARSGLEQRVQAILEGNRSRRPVGRVTGSALALGTVLIVFTVALLSPLSHNDATALTANADEQRGKEEAKPKTTRPANAGENSEIHSSRTKLTGKSDPNTVEVTGTVVDESGAPVVNAEVIASHFRKPSATKSAGNGTFSFYLDKGHASFLGLIASDSSGRLGYYPNPSGETNLAPIRIVLKKACEIAVTVSDADGRPAANADVGITAGYAPILTTPTNEKGQATLGVPADAPLMNVFAFGRGVGFDYLNFRQADQPSSDPYHLPMDYAQPISLVLSRARSVRVRVIDDQQRPMPGTNVSVGLLERPKRGTYFNSSGVAELMGKTDETGMAIFRSLPADNLHKIRFSISAEGYCVAEEPAFDLAAGIEEITATVAPLVPVRGKVTFADGGAAPGAQVLVGGDGPQYSSFHGTTTCNAEGAFEIPVHPDNYCIFVASSRRFASPAQMRIVRARQPVEPVNLVLQPAARVLGKVTIGDDRRPLVGQYVSVYQSDGDDYYKLPKERQLPNPRNSNNAVTPRVTRHVITDGGGRFEFFLGPGRYYAFGPGGVEPPKFEISTQTELDLSMHADRPAKGEISGRVVLNADPRRIVPEADVEGWSNDLYNGRLKAVTNGQGVFSATRDLANMLVRAQTEDGLLSGIVQISADDAQVTIPIGPTTSAHGRLVDEVTGQALADRQIDCGVRITHKDGTFSRHFGGTARTNALGEFGLTGLVPGWKYELSVVQEYDAEGRARSWRTVSPVTPETADVVNLGDVKLPPPERAVLLEDLISRSMSAKPLPEERLATKLRDAQLAEQRVLLLATVRGSLPCQRFFSVYHNWDRQEKNRAVRQALSHFALLAVDTSEGEAADGARPLLERLKLSSPDGDDALLAVIDGERNVVITATAEALSRDGQLDGPKLTSFLKKHARPLPDAEMLLADGLARAEREDKRGRAMHTGALCAPCVLLSRYLDRHRELIAKDYVVVKLDARFTNGDAAIRRVRPDGEVSIPWMAILDAAGKPLATSDGPDGNIGYPSRPAETAHFETMLQTTARRLSDAQIKSLVEALSDIGGK